MDNKWERFREEIRYAVAHLHDPDYQPSDLVCEIIGCDPNGGGPAVQSSIIRVIEDLGSKTSASEDTRDRLEYTVLFYRFVQKLTQEQTAERLLMSVRQLRRVQREAIHVLARALWEHGWAVKMLQENVAEEDARKGTTDFSAQAQNGLSQLQRDLAWLERGAPHVIADVSQAIHKVIGLESALSFQHGVELQASVSGSELTVSIHPTVLRQILIIAVSQLIKSLEPKEVVLSASREDGKVKIVVTASLCTRAGSLDLRFVRGLLAPHGGTVHVAATDDDQMSISIVIPPTGEISVLVMDDNPDMVHFYRRCLSGTRYRITNVATEQELMETVETSHPAAIVLDIMLPSVDGWELLVRLRRHPLLDAVPIIVCSVIREPELALALGAAAYLPKPVTPRDLIETLNHVLRAGVQQNL